MCYLLKITQWSISKVCYLLKITQWSISNVNVCYLLKITVIYQQSVLYLLKITQWSISKVCFVLKITQWFISNVCYLLKITDLSAKCAIYWRYIEAWYIFLQEKALKMLRNLKGSMKWPKRATNELKINKNIEIFGNKTNKLNSAFKLKILMSVQCTCI